MLKPVIQDPEGEERPRPDIKRGLLGGPFDVRSLALTGLFVLAVFYTLYVARSFLLPVVLALLLSFVLTPVVRFLKQRLKVPEALGAGLVMLGLIGGAGLAFYELSGPAYEWLEKAPASLRRMEGELREIRKPVQTIGKATAQVEKIAGGGAAPNQVTVQTETLGQRLLSQTTELISAAVVMLVLLYFLLAAGDLFLRKLIKVLPNLSDKKRAVEIARQIEDDISAYLATVTVINLLLGVAVAAVMYLLDMPNPLLWGALAAVLNYIPYLGAIATIGVLAVVGFMTFDDLWQQLLPALSFVGLNILEAYILTPMLLGKRLTLNPVVIFLGLTFWGWLWGIAGALLAVPLLAVFKIFCDHSETLAPIGEFLGD